MSEQYPVLPGAEPFYAENGPVGVLLSHGFTGTPHSMRPLAEAYAKAGYTVCLPRLKGHGTHYEDMERTTFHDWIASVEEGYEWLKKRCGAIFATGLSMGGTLTLHLAEHHPDIRGIVLVNAAIDIPAIRAGLAGGGELPRYLDSIGSDLKNPDVKELAYEKTPTASLLQLARLMEQTKAKLDRIVCPALIFVSDEDHVVPPGNADIIFQGISSTEKEIVRLRNSYHVATLDYDQPMIIERSLEFFAKHAG
ncbi:alpha/beta fold hydrolase [Geobacillus proteiniphilus]|uniref:Alpha/beta fold hydrolase n=1 Tax=Geobacillus proteiniphilus TaxID=860353 RepID=A0A1Q5SQC8_9BACL|nr:MULTISPECIES: alpha/beta fold hydrolase [Geobacillus]OKO90172.1 putative esterase/lipase [Geobacillus proteiniphilus]OPX02720.1 lipase [Geobacillus sp. LEMMY01]WMJ15507.1 alpha/beta fold hydrolase [Geobacillus proteiniphilus]